MQDLWINRRPTVLLVTHDLRESAYLASRICVMSSRPAASSKISASPSRARARSNQATNPISPVWYSHCA
ncbi:hypothetical protein UMZ34_12685 [Halopseudomonas pachastrellae]|nr:hypothetical protein UMZ34_12685 [Halopseudomonas pachastrellae]